MVLREEGFSGGSILGDLTVAGVTTLIGIADGGLASYDLKVGDTVTPDYGMIQIGDAVIGRTSHKVGNMDIDGAIVFRNMGTPPTSNIEFVFTESGGDAIRFALAKSGVGLATYNPRSMLIAGPAVLNDEIVTVGYWQTNNDIFHNLLCDTSGFGADLGVQNDLEVEGDIFTDSIKESTVGAGITLQPKLKIDGIIILEERTEAIADIAGYGQLWVKTVTPNEFWFTDDSGIDYKLGMDYGSCYGMEIGWTQASAVQNTWYDISDADMADGELLGVTHDGSGKLTVAKAGKYAADWAGAFEGSASNIHITIAFSIDGTEVDEGMNHFETVAVNREESCAGNAILDLTAGQTVNVSIRTTDAGTPNLLVDHLLLRLVQVGG